MKNIPLQRAISYLLLLGALPLFVILVYTSAKKEQQASLLERLYTTCMQKAEANQRELYSKIIRTTYQDKDHFYLESELSKIALLSQEIQTIQKILNGGFHPDEEALKRRLTQISGQDNALIFTESAEKNYVGMKESVSQLQRTVEASSQDIQKILTRIEGVQIGQEKAPATRPHLIISDFKMERKKGPLGDSYGLNIKIIKREYTK